MKDYLSATERTMAEYFGAMLKEPASDIDAVAPQAAVTAPRSQLRPLAERPVAPAAVLDSPLRQAQPVEELLKQVAQHVTQPKPAVPAPKEEINDWVIEPVAPTPAPAKEEINDWVIEESPSAVAVAGALNPELQGLQHLLQDSGLGELTDSIIPPTSHGVPISDKEFQTLFFEVAGLTLALPLKQLGGIHPITRVHKLIGKPDWFKGVMNARGGKHNVVDTAMWVMPEKYSTKMAEHLNYQYLIMLDSSPWGLAVEKLVTAEALSQEGIKWRTTRGKRPWLAGMAIDRMCALLDVEELISLLDKGLES